MRRVLLTITGLLAFVALAPAVSSARTARPAARLAPHAFASCASLVHYARAHFAVTKGAVDVPVQALSEPALPTKVSTATPGSSGEVAPTAAAAPASDSSFSTTNVQEAGVDEPDVVKTDGTTIFAVQGQTLYAVSAKDGAATLVGSLALPASGYDQQLLLRGSRLIVISSTSGFARPLATAAIAPISGPYGLAARTTITEVDVHDPAAMTVSRTMAVDGRYVDARQNGSTARIVIASSPRAVTQVATRTASSGWVPQRRFTSHLTSHHYIRPVARCSAVAHPRDFSGLGMLTILTVNLDHGLYTADTDALMADAQVVYGSADSLYVATQKWVDPAVPVSDLPSGSTTVIQRFDVSDPDRTTPGSTGAVPGFLLNQFSLSESDGHLRVATTTQPSVWDGQQLQTPSQSQITVLDDTGGQLTTVGQLKGLGTGQRIYSVRFVGDSAYVVTFRQVDPLYVIDLSDPTAPRLAGQLELEGYSSYLQPVGDGLLLGIGADISANEPTGTQLELFDVSDASAPKLVSKVALGGGSSTTAAYDHHALLWWPATGLAVLPVQLWSTMPQSSAEQFVGAIGYHIDKSGIAEVGRVSHDAVDGYLPAIQRSLVIGGRLFTLSSAGVMASDLSSLARESFAAFPVAPAGGSGGTVTSPPGVVTTQP